MGEVKTETHQATMGEPIHATGDLAVAPQGEVEVAETADVFDAVIAAVDKLDVYAKAQDKLLNIVVKRTFAGDWVCHDRENTPLEQRKANIGGAAADRIALFLGIQEANWVEHPKEWSEDRKHYRFRFSADFTFRGLKRHAIGVASTQDKFFGFAHGEWKDLAEIKEDDIRIAAYNECVKRGVVRLTGIRNIPILKLKELGYDINLVHYANFADKGKQIASSELKPGEGGLIWKTILPVKMEKFEGTSKQSGKPWTRFDIHDKEGVKYALFGTGESKRVAALADAHSEARPIKVGFRMVEFNKQQNYQIDKVEGANE